MTRVYWALVLSRWRRETSETTERERTKEREMNIVEAQIRSFLSYYLKVKCFCSDQRLVFHSMTEVDGVCFQQEVLPEPTFPTMQQLASCITLMTLSKLNNKLLCSRSGSTKYTDKDSGGMLVWSPYHTIVDSKRKSTHVSCPVQTHQRSEVRGPDTHS